MTEKKKYHLPLIALLAVAIGTYDMVTSSSLVLFCVGLGGLHSHVWGCLNQSTVEQQNTLLSSP